MKRMILCAAAALVAVAVSAQSRGYENGYRGNVEVEVGTLLDSYLNIGFLTSHGYGTSYGLYAGAGTGIFFSPEHYSYISVPVFVDVKYNFIDSVFSPFVRMRVGTMIGMDELYAGVYCSPSVGVDMGRVSVSFSYGYSNGRASLSGNHALLYDRHTLDVGVGIWF